MTLSPAPRGKWRAVHAADPHALITQSPEWTDVLIASGGWSDASLWCETADGRDLILPMVRRTIGGSRGIAASFGEGWGMGGVLAAGGPAAADIAAVVEVLERSSALQTAIRPNPLVGDAWASAVANRGIIGLPKSAHVLVLGENADADEVFAGRLKTKARRNVRRAERLGVEVVADSSGDAVDVFYDMFLKSLARWADRSREPIAMARYRGKRRDPIDKFRTMAERLGEAMRIHVAYLEGQPAAAAIVLANPGGNAHYTRGVMDIDVAGRSNAADLVQWSAICDAIALGCHTYHMGESGTSTSLAHFKEKFGARPVPYAQYRIERLPLTAADAKLRAVAKKLIGFRDA